MHEPKQETFDVAAGINIDPKGFHRRVDHYEVTECGLYMARGANHPDFGYLESWLLPQLDLRVSIFHYRDHMAIEQDFYVDIAEITVDREAQVWRTRDMYVDLSVNRGQPTEVLDLDEITEAVAEGLIDATSATRALGATTRAVEGIAQYDFQMLDWLNSLKMPLHWADTVTLTPVDAP